MLYNLSQIFCTEINKREVEFFLCLITLINFFVSESDNIHEPDYDSPMLSSLRK